jgi:acetylglutamate kinase
MKSVIVKIGGKAAENTERLRELCAEMAGLSARFRFIIVHGGGAEVTVLSRKLGMEAVFNNGVRQTSAAEMDVVDMVLCGKVNKHLVRLCRSCGLDAVGLSGSDGALFIGRPMNGAPSESRTGEVAAVQPRLLELLLREGFLPVISPTSMDERGRGLNINADEAAFALACALSADSLVFLSDIPGILRDGKVIDRLAGSQTRECIDSGVISGGMIPKATASVQAIGSGVANVIIGQYDHEGALSDLLEGKVGTRICG